MNSDTSYEDVSYSLACYHRLEQCVTVSSTRSQILIATTQGSIAALYIHHKWFIPLPLFLLTTLNPLMLPFILRLFFRWLPIPAFLRPSKTILLDMYCIMIPEQMKACETFNHRFLAKEPRVVIYPILISRIQRTHALEMFSQPALELIAQLTASTVLFPAFEVWPAAWSAVVAVPVLFYFW
jgi:hypothetical protein